MLAANYLPEDFTVTLKMKLYNNCALPLTFHFSRSPKKKLLTDKQKGKPLFLCLFLPGCLDSCCHRRLSAVDLYWPCGSPLTLPSAHRASKLCMKVRWPVAEWLQPLSQSLWLQMYQKTETSCLEKPSEAPSFSSDLWSLGLSLPLWAPLT